jgi:hypothetical protein
MSVQKRIVKYIITGILLLIGYFFASHHIIINEREFSTLKKSYLTFEYTFYNVTDRDPEDVMRIDLLREAGIGDLLVEMGLLGEMQKEKLEDRYDNEDE